MYWKIYSCHFHESKFTVVGFNEMWKGREFKAMLIFHCTKSNRVCHFVSWYLSKKRKRKKKLWWFRWQMWNSDFLSFQPKYPQLSSQLITESDAMTALAPPYNTYTHTLETNLYCCPYVWKRAWTLLPIHAKANFMSNITVSYSAIHNEQCSLWNKPLFEKLAHVWSLKVQYVRLRGYI